MTKEKAEFETRDVEGNAQFLIATHSPILLSYPGAVLITYENIGQESAYGGSVFASLNLGEIEDVVGAIAEHDGGVSAEGSDRDVRKRGGGGMLSAVWVSYYGAVGGRN